MVHAQSKFELNQVQGRFYLEREKEKNFVHIGGLLFELLARSRAFNWGFQDVVCSADCELVVSYDSSGFRTSENLSIY